MRFNEEMISSILTTYASWGPFPGFFLAFIKSFIPPLPTILIISMNAAAYGIGKGFLYSWLGIISGSLSTFLIARRASRWPFVQKILSHPKVQKTKQWIIKNDVTTIFTFSVLPIGPFVTINLAAAAVRVPLSNYLVALLPSKAIMVFTVSYLGKDLFHFFSHPIRLVVSVLLLALVIFAAVKIKSLFIKKAL